MVNWKSRKLTDVLLLANGLVLLVLLNTVSSRYFFRADLTDEKRYSIKPQTKNILRNLQEDVFVEVYLTGDLNPEFQRFQKAIRETLDEFRIYSNNRLNYRVINPTAAASEKARNEFMTELASKGIQPTRVIDTKDGQRIEKIVFPGVVVSVGAAEVGVHLLKGNKANSQVEEINQSIEGVEFELANAIYKLVNDDPKRIGLVKGHGEIDSLEIAAFSSSLSEVYQVSDVNLNSGTEMGFDALVIARPRTAFTEAEKFALDQYIMTGGNVLFLLDKMQADMDSVSHENYFAFPYQLNLDDQLFRYGVRINVDLVQDRISGRYPVVTGQSGSTPQIQLMDWEFFPLINHYADHPITHNLDAVILQFSSSIDTVKAEGIRKTPLFFTSQNARKVVAPVNVSLQYLRKNLKAEDFVTPFIPMAYLLEGNFTSLYMNRFLPEGVDVSSFQKRGKHAKIIVVSDGDIARNVVNPRTRQPMPLGFDPFTNYTFANEDLLMNMIAYLTDENGLIKARNKEIRIRPLSEEKIAEEKTLWQVVNLGLPLIVLVIFGVIRNMMRRKRYADF